jgi:lipopolysaccharide transport system ATP-binding protein
MSPVIRVENVSKQYRLGEVGTGSLAHDVNRWWHKIRGKEDPYLKIGEVNDRTKKAESGKQKAERASNGSASKRFQLSAFNSQLSHASSDYAWALRDVSFEVKQGEVLGIIGRNGAGKSTLLKILSRVTQPTTGQIKVKGRIASLLEVGTGFHPELTGRENIFLNGAILGMRKAEIAAKFDEIVEFSGCERYIDTPVKRYSSGMYVRLAFAVAAHLESEILILDEVLAVGDAEFQKKCLGKMKDVAGQGRTVLFVTHNLSAVLALCPKTVLMGNGVLKGFGISAEIIDTYLRQNHCISYEVEYGKDDATAVHPNVRVYGARIRNAKLVAGGATRVSESIFVEVDYEILNPKPFPRLNIHVGIDDGICAFACFEDEMPAGVEGRYKSRMEIPPNFLNARDYSVSIFFTSINPDALLLDLNNVLSLEVLDDPTSITRQNYQGYFPGVIRPQLIWSTEQL